MANKFFIGYSFGNINIPKSVLVSYKNGGKVENDTVFSNKEQIHFVLRFYKRTGKDNVFELPDNQKPSGISYKNTCREFIMSYIRAAAEKMEQVERIEKKLNGKDVTEVRRLSKEFVDRVSIGIFMNYSNFSYMDALSRNAIKVLNIIEDKFDVGRSKLLRVRGKGNILFPESIKESADYKTYFSSPKYRKCIEETTTVYMFRPSEFWLRDGVLTSAFMLLLRLSFREVIDKNIKKYQDLVDLVDKLYEEEVGSGDVVSISGFINKLTEVEDLKVHKPFSNADIKHLVYFKYMFGLLGRHYKDLIKVNYSISGSSSNYGLAQFTNSVMCCSGVFSDPHEEDLNIDVKKICLIAKKEGFHL